VIGPLSLEKTEILTGIRFYQYHICAMLLVGAYSVYHLLFGFQIIGVALSLATVLNGALVVFKIYGIHSILLREASVIAIASAVFSACYFLGMRGIAWVFPLVVGIFFNYLANRALPYALVSITICLLAALNTVDKILVIRMIFPLLLTIGFAYLYRVTIDKERFSLEKEANEDYLTGICNRRSFQKWLKRAIQMLEKEGHFLAVFYLDIDDFKLINDTYGHEVGDKVLTEVSKRLYTAIRPTDSITQNSEHHKLARIAGDEFVVATNGLKYHFDAEKIASRLLSVVNQPIKTDGVVIEISVSIGVALCMDNAVDSEKLLADADAALYKSKAQGKNRVTFFDDNIANKIKHKKHIAKGLEIALRNDGFFLNFMPIFAKDGQTIAGAEILIRCRSEALKGIGPDEYIPVAEESGLIRNIDLFVIERAFKRMIEILPKIGDSFTFAINISAKELLNEAFPEQLQQLVVKYQIPPNQVELELTETSLVSMDRDCIAMLHRIKEIGFRISLDDFGTGYTAFSQLEHYPVDTLKIDRSFVWNISDPQHEQQTMVDVILSLAKLYKVEVVAEGVENQEQLDYLKRSNCDFFQGFFLCKPLAWEMFCDQYFPEK
jgi:diguanylate cyclase